MRDPHVNWLTYRMGHSSDVSYENPPQLSFSCEGFTGTLKDEILTVAMKDHFASVAEARSHVEGFLRAWELHDRILGARDEISFTFDDAEVVDRDPVPPGKDQVVSVEAAVLSLSGTTVSLHVTRKSYPAPPTGFVVTPDVETMWQRYEGYRAGREPLLSMGYFCLSAVEVAAGGRREAANRYEIGEKVLRKIGELTSERGDEKTARKMSRTNAVKPMSHREKAWLEEALKVVIARVAEVAGGKSVQQLTMDDLPRL